MLAHGISTGGLFLAIGVVYERRHTRRLDEFGGLAAVMPRFTAVFLIITLASIGVPGLSGFIGEFLILIGTFTAYDSWQRVFTMFAHPKPLAGIAATGVILGAVYMLYLFQKMMFGPLTNPRNRELKDLSWRETLVFLPVVLMAFWLGLYPSTFLSRIDPPVKSAVEAFRGKYEAEGEQPDTLRMAPSAFAPPTGEAPAPAAGTPLVVPLGDQVQR
jgi:NADH-quinone oxidoreductase subunit M